MVVLVKKFLGVPMRVFFALLLSFTSPAWAAPSIPIKFYWVRSPYIIPFLETKRAIRHVQGYYRKYFKIQLVVRSLKKQRDLFPDTRSGNEAFKRFFAWSDYTLKGRKRGEITQVITGPLLTEKEWYSAGIGFISCPTETDLLNFSITYATLRSFDKHDRFVHAKAVIAHELGHNLSASHVNDCSLMDTMLLSCLGNKGKRVTAPNPHSKWEIQQCVTTIGLTP